MKICLVSARFPPQRCGVGDYTYFIACALARVGHQIDVLTGIGVPDESLSPLPSNVRVHRLISTWGLNGLPKILKSIRLLQPDSLLIQYAPTAFEHRGMTLGVNLLPSLVRIASNIQVGANCHELYAAFDDTLVGNLRATWQRGAAMLIAWGSNYLSVVANEWENRLRRLGVRKQIHVIPVGSNIPAAFISEEERMRIRNHLLGGTEGFLLAGFGAQHDRDVPAILYGLRQLKSAARTKLVWIGGGRPIEEHRLRIQSAIVDNQLNESDIEWTGVLPHTEVSRLLSACDIAVLPFVDGVSTRRTSAVAALQHGLPLLTTRGTPPEPWFQHGDNVYLVPIGDKQALADGLLELATRPDLRTRLGKGARALYSARFDWSVVAKHVSNLTAESLRL
jgi:glycosyltransferase involved in cell wall biosynthesis